MRKLAWLGFKLVCLLNMWGNANSTHIVLAVPLALPKTEPRENSQRLSYQKGQQLLLLFSCCVCRGKEGQRKRSRGRHSRAVSQRVSWACWWGKHLLGQSEVAAVQRHKTAPRIKITWSTENPSLNPLLAQGKILGVSPEVSPSCCVCTCPVPLPVHLTLAFFSCFCKPLS